jgi:hypothetical protein
MKLTIKLETTNGFEMDAKMRKHTNRRRLTDALQDMIRKINTDNRFDGDHAFDTDLGLVLRSESTITTICIEEGES